MKSYQLTLGGRAPITCCGLLLSLVFVEELAEDHLTAGPIPKSSSENKCVFMEKSWEHKISAWGNGDRGHNRDRHSGMGNVDSVDCDIEGMLLNPEITKMDQKWGKKEKLKKELIVDQKESKTYMNIHEEAWSVRCPNQVPRQAQWEEPRQVWKKKVGRPLRRKE